MVMNNGVNIHCKAVTAQVFTIVGFLVEIGISIEKSKGNHEESLSIRKTSVTLTFNSPVIYYFLFLSF